MIIVYVAHPIGGDVKRNMELVEAKCGQIYKSCPEVVPIAPYIMALKFLNDSDPDDRARGVKMNKEFFSRRLIDELWLFGPKISQGMREEIGWAREYKIPVVPRAQNLVRELAHLEIQEGSAIKVCCDGPGGGPVVARLIGYLPDDEGVSIRNMHWQKKRLFYHQIPWCDVALIAPIGVPLESEYKNSELLK